MVTVIKMLQLLKIVLSKISGVGNRYFDQYITNISRYVDELNTTTVVIFAKATKHLIYIIKIVLSLKYNLRNSNNTIILSKNKKYLII